METLETATAATEKLLLVLIFIGGDRSLNAKNVIFFFTTLKNTNAKKIETKRKNSARHKVWYRKSKQKILKSINYHKLNKYKIKKMQINPFSVGEEGYRTRG